MPKPTIQAQNAIDKLKAAGLARNEFRVRTERIYVGRHPETGRQMYEYGDALITVFSSKERQLELAQEMADQGLRVELFQYTDGSMAYPYVMDVYWSKPGLYLKQEGVKDKHGMTISRKIG